MSIELSREARERAVTSLVRYSEVHLDTALSRIEAAELLAYVLTEIGPSVHNAALAALRAQFEERLGDTAAALEETEFGYWPAYDRTRRRG